MAQNVPHQTRHPSAVTLPQVRIALKVMRQHGIGGVGKGLNLIQHLGCCVNHIQAQHVIRALRLGLAAALHAVRVTAVVNVFFCGFGGGVGFGHAVFYAVAG